MGDYRQQHYNTVIGAIQQEFGIKNTDLPGHIWIAWRVAIKRMFDDGLLIKEIVAAIPEAAEKRRWPDGTSFMRRLHDVALKNRREAWTARRDGMHGLGDILQHKHLQA
jgi:hypothetical protein